MNARWNRRTFLKSLGFGAGLFPFVPLLDVHAESSAPPKRLVFFFSGNGTIHESWSPTTVGGKLVLSPILAPLEKQKSRLLVVEGLSHTVVLKKGDRNGHSAGINTALTGQRAKSIDPNHPLRSMALGISVDQFLAQKLAAKTKLPTLECGIQVICFSTDNSCLSYSGPLAPISPENSPYLVFDRLFRNFSQPSAQEDPASAERAADRKRILESVSHDLDAVKQRLPQEDRIKMDGHLESIRALDHSLSTGVGSATQVCSQPKLGAKLDVWKNDNLPAIAKLQMDLLVMALACDLTRIGTIQFGRAGASHRFSWLGPEFDSDPVLAATDEAKGFHALAHKESDPDCRAKLVKIHTWYATQLAYLLEKLAAIPEAGGTMLDHTVVVWVNELGSGGHHDHVRVPWLIAGNADGYFKTGRVVSFPDEPHNRLLMSLCHAMGVPCTSFGDPEFCTAGVLPLHTI